MSVDDQTDLDLSGDAGALGLLPRLTRRQARLHGALATLGESRGPAARSLAWLEGWLGGQVELGAVEINWRPVGLRRTGAVAQLSWPRLATRFAIGLETPLAHAIVDRLLGFDRPLGADRLALSPVEWGILTFAAGESARALGAESGPLGPWDLVVDRVGPDAFDVADLGQVITLCWPLTVGSASGSLRLWIPEILVARWLAAHAPPASRTFETASCRRVLLLRHGGLGPVSCCFAAAWGRSASAESSPWSGHLSPARRGAWWARSHWSSTTTTADRQRSLLVPSTTVVDAGSALRVIPGTSLVPKSQPRMPRS
ncbi:MAG: hypothetical protein U0794_07860 [Isosphaeraceae bacterium]